MSTEFRPVTVRPSFQLGKMVTCVWTPEDLLPALFEALNASSIGEVVIRTIDVAQTDATQRKDRATLRQALDEISVIAGGERA